MASSSTNTFRTTAPTPSARCWAASTTARSGCASRRLTSAPRRWMCRPAPNGAPPTSTSSTSLKKKSPWNSRSNLNLKFSVNAGRPSPAFTENFKFRLLREFQGDFFFKLVDEVEVGGAPFGAGLHIHLRGALVNRLDAHPDLAVVDAAQQRADGVGAVVRDIFVDDDAIVDDNGHGSLVDLVKRALVAAGHGILAPGNGKRTGVGDGFNTAGGEN